MSTGHQDGYNFSRIIRLSGDLRSRGPSPTDFCACLGQVLQNITRVSFVHAVFHNTSYNIIGPPDLRANNRLTIAYYLSGVFVTSQDIYVDPGFYTSTDLIAYINPRIDSGSDLQFVYEYVPKSGKIALVFAPTVTYDEVHILNPDGHSIFPDMGFVFPADNDYNVPLAPYTPYQPNLGGLSEVYLRSYALGPGNSIGEDGAIDNICINIPVTVPYGSQQVFDCKVDSLCQVTYPSPRNIQSLDIQLVDRQGNIIDLNGSNLKIDLRVWFNRL